MVVSLENTIRGLAQGAPRSSRIDLWAFACGELGIAFAPYEMFDSDGVAIRRALVEAGCYDMVFSCGNSNSTYSYMPAEAVYDHGGCEVYTCKYEKGTASVCNQNLIEG